MFANDMDRRRKMLVAALRSAAEECGAEPEYYESALQDRGVYLEVIGDIVANLLHVGDELGLTPEQLFEQSLFHYDSERIEKHLEEDAHSSAPVVNAPVQRRVLLVAPSKSPAPS